MRETGAVAPVEKLWTDSSLHSVSRRIADRSVYEIDFGELAVAHIFLRERHILMVPLNSHVSEQTLQHLAADQVLPKVLAHDGKRVLHAGAVASGLLCIAFVGKSGLGKSTLGISMARDGWALMGDDALVVAKEGGLFQCRAVKRSLRLLPDSVATFFPDGPVGQLVADYSSKSEFGYCLRGNETDLPVPLTAIFFLAKKTMGDAINLRRMNVAESCMGLICNSFLLDASDPLIAKRNLITASALATAVPAFELAYPRIYARLPDVHFAIRHQLSEIAAPENSESATEISR